MPLEIPEEFNTCWNYFKIEPCPGHEGIISNGAKGESLRLNSNWTLARKKTFHPYMEGLTALLKLWKRRLGLRLQ
jgi:hypothetical protein